MRSPLDSVANGTSWCSLQRSYLSISLSPTLIANTYITARICSTPRTTASPARSCTPAAPATSRSPPPPPAPSKTSSTTKSVTPPASPKMSAQTLRLVPPTPPLTLTPCAAPYVVNTFSVPSAAKKCPSEKMTMATWMPTQRVDSCVPVIEDDGLSILLLV